MLWKSVCYLIFQVARHDGKLGKGMGGDSSPSGCAWRALECEAVGEGWKGKGRRRWQVSKRTRSEGGVEGTA